MGEAGDAEGRAAVGQPGAARDSKRNPGRRGDDDAARCRASRQPGGPALRRLAMNVAPLGGMIGSAAGAPLSQAAGSEAERASRETTTQQRQVDANQKAELAA